MSPGQGPKIVHSQTRSLNAAGDLVLLSIDAEGQDDDIRQTGFTMTRYIDVRLVVPSKDGVH